MAATLHSGIIPGDEAKKLYSYPTLPSDSDKLLLGDGTWGDVYHHPTMTAVTGYPTANVAPNFGDKFRFMQISRDSLGHVSGMASRWVTIPSYTATDSKVGLMSTADKVKLDGIASLANNYTHPTYTARTGKPTANQTPAFGATFTISQFTSDSTGHVTAATDRTVKIPTLPTVSSSAYGVMTAAMYNSLTSAAASSSSVSNVNARLASIESILTTACTSSIDASGCMVFTLSNGKTLLKIDKAGEW